MTPATRLVRTDSLSLKTRSALAAVLLELHGVKLSAEIRAVAEPLAAQDRLAVGWLHRLEELTVSAG